MGRVERGREIARRRKRRDTVKKIRFQYSQAKTESEKEDLRAKMRKVSPFVNLDEAPAK